FLTATRLAAWQPPPPTPIHWSAPEIVDAVKPGDIVAIPIVAHIDEGWHLYALEPIEGGPLPTTLSTAPDRLFSLNAKNIDRPEPTRAPDPNFGTETSYYEESATFTLPITVAAGAPSGDRDIQITARFQACNDRICLRPQTATMTVKTSVRR